MQKISGKLKIFLYSGFALTAIAILLFSFALLVSYDSVVNYFNPSIFLSIGVALVVISILFFLTVFFLVPKGELDGASPLTIPVLIPSIISAAAFLICGIVMMMCGFGVADACKTFTCFAQTNTVLPFAGIFSIIASFYFIFNCFVKDDTMTKPHTLLGYIVPLATVMIIAASYFDITVSMNAPAKQLFHLTLIAFMVWFIYEIRNIIGVPCPRCYLAFGLCAVMISGCASVPWLVAYAFGKLTVPLYPTYLLYNMIALAIFAYSAVRLTVFVCARDLLERISDQTPVETAEEEEV